ncbi:hypothetical protein PFISCL1PPCAC_21435, partial [Pristionchus fissidentatus]
NQFIDEQSPTRFINGVPYFIALTREIKPDCIRYSARLNCNEESDNSLWTAEVECSVTLLNEDPSKNMVCKKSAKFANGSVEGDSMLF